MLVLQRKRAVSDVCVCLWTVPRNHLGGVACGVASLTERGRVDCVQSSREQLVFVMVRCFYHHVVDNALLMCFFFTDTSGSISTASGLASMSFKVGVSCCAAYSNVPLDDVNTVAAKVLKLERPVLP